MRKKLYKSGKLWVAAAATSLAIAVGPNVVNADTTTPTTQTTTTVAGVKQSTSVDDNKVVTEVTGNKGVTSDNKTTTSNNSADNNGSKTDANGVGNPTDISNIPTDSVKINANGQTTTVINPTTTNSGSTNNKTTAVDQTTNDTKNNTTTIITTPEAKAETSKLKLVGGVDGYYDSDKNGNYQFKLYKNNDHIKSNDDKPVTGLQTIDYFVQYFDIDGTQVKGAYRTVDGDKYYFASGSGNALKQATVVPNENGTGTKLVGFDSTGKVVKNGFSSDNEGNTYYFDENGNFVTGWRTVDGQQYYFEDNGALVKSGQKTVGDNVYYFDSSDGHAIVGNKNQYTEGLTSQNDDFTEHNAIINNDSKSIDNVNGYITAASWYRPKDILENGQTWVSSTETDQRPLLMTWWPDKNTEADYVNFMAKRIATVNSDGKIYSALDSQEVLNKQAEAIQIEIEKYISQNATNYTLELKKLFGDFIATQPNWNITSEDVSTDHFQGGALVYANSTMTPWANSDYRFLNRTPTNQKGDVYGDKGGYELLLANDVDNSNPVVQAEQLNWLYYLTHFGEITANDSDANFDSIRIDAVDNVDADLLQIAADYMKSAYGVGDNDAITNKHLSILEDWSDNDFKYVSENGNNQLTLDKKVQDNLLNVLTKFPTNRQNMETIINNRNVDRKNDDGSQTVTPNYSFVRAHDSEVQTVIARIIQDKFPDSGSGLIQTTDEINKAFEIYNADQLLADKHYTHYNIPSAYALLLTNKDTIPRVYYGDLFTDNGDYMANTTPYYKAIDALLKLRVKYVSGSQTSEVDKNHTDVLTSVRMGNNTTEGVGIIVSNNPDLNLGNDEITLNMGQAHANQTYRAALLTTDTGITVYNSDEGAPIATTNSKGQLIFSAKEINNQRDTNIRGVGKDNNQVSGYLAVWVPVGADTNHNATTQALTETTTDGKTLHSNAALDSNLIYEGFSNYQTIPDGSDPEKYTNAIIAKNVQTFKDWGVTSFQLAPQYRSSEGTSFLDETLKNGYAFTDRYDLGFDNNPTKYGTAEQLRAAIKALHSVGIQAMADFVPDQIYTLPGEEAVTATRTNNQGVYKQDSDFNNLVYIAKTKSSGQDYQSKYGGQYLDLLKDKYSNLFENKQLSTGESIDPSEKITQWSAKYFNGTNIQGRGKYFALKDFASNQYLTISDTSTSVLPKQLTNQKTQTGFYKDDKGIGYYSLSGYQAKNSFIQDDQGNWYYFNNDGYMVTGYQNIDNKDYYFLQNGVKLNVNGLVSDNDQTYYFKNNQLQKGSQTVQGITYFFDSQTGLMKKDYFDFTADNKVYYYGTDGVRYTNRFYSNWGKMYYFGEDGARYTNRFYSNWGNMYYFGEDGARYTNRFYSNWGNMYYFGEDGARYTNRFYSNWGKLYYFGNDGARYTNQSYSNWGKTYYFGNDGARLTNQFRSDSQGNLYYYGNDGARYTNQFYSNWGNTYYFGENGARYTNKFYSNWGHKYYFDASGVLVKNREIKVDGIAYIANAEGVLSEKKR
ncbi:glycoside hydrolase family 70 protein [Leuconostoc suionicum]|uniref:glycoside hydrolase family 70 protein n=1 Tax=Leuconostoc suionicum TaxID=1511761 RepID=UPI003D27D9C1